MIPSTYLCTIPYTQFHQSSLPRNPWTLPRRKLHINNPKIMASSPNKILLLTKKQQRSKRTLLSQPSKKPKDPQSKSPSYLVPKSSLIPPYQKPIQKHYSQAQPTSQADSNRLFTLHPRGYGLVFSRLEIHISTRPSNKPRKPPRGKKLSMTRPPEGPAKRSTKRL